MGGLKRDYKAVGTQQRAFRLGHNLFIYHKQTLNILKPSLLLKNKIDECFAFRAILRIICFIRLNLTLLVCAFRAICMLNNWKISRGVDKIQVILLFTNYFPHQIIPYVYKTILRILYMLGLVANLLALNSRFITRLPAFIASNRPARKHCERIRRAIATMPFLWLTLSMKNAIWLWVYGKIITCQI